MALTKDELKNYQLCCISPTARINNGTFSHNTGIANPDPQILCLLIDKLAADSDVCWLVRVRTVKETFIPSRYLDTTPPTHIPIFNSRLEFPVEFSPAPRFTTTFKHQHDCDTENAQKTSRSNIFLSKFDTQMLWYYVDLGRVLQVSIESFDEQLTRDCAKYVACRCSIELIKASVAIAIRNQGLAIDSEKTSDILAVSSQDVSKYHAKEGLHTETRDNLTSSTGHGSVEKSDDTTKDVLTDATLLQSPSLKSRPELMAKPIETSDEEPEDGKLNGSGIDSDPEAVRFQLQAVYWVDSWRAGRFNKKLLRGANVTDTFCVRLDFVKTASNRCYICPFTISGDDVPFSIEEALNEQADVEELIVRVPYVHEPELGASPSQQSKASTRVLSFYFNLCAYVRSNAVKISGDWKNKGNFYTTSSPQTSFEEAFKRYQKKYLEQMEEQTAYPL